MSWLDDPRFAAPNDAVGEWCVTQHALFEDVQPPLAVRFAIEKRTAQLLARERADGRADTLRYSGTSGAGGHPTTIRLELKAATADRYLYGIASRQTAPCRWEDEHAFRQACERRFQRWCATLCRVEQEARWRIDHRIPIHDIVLHAVTTEDALAARREDPTPVAMLQHHVLTAMRRGMGFFTAHKEGGTHLYFDGRVFRREDYGDEPRASAYDDDAAMVDCLRRFYDWDAQRDAYPHKKTEREIWTYIVGQLRPRR